MTRAPAGMGVRGFETPRGKDAKFISGKSTCVPTPDGAALDPWRLCPLAFQSRTHPGPPRSHQPQLPLSRRRSKLPPPPGETSAMIVPEGAKNISFVGHTDQG